MCPASKTEAVADVRHTAEEQVLRLVGQPVLAMALLAAPKCLLSPMKTNGKNNTTLDCSLSG
eukprot:10589500-Prorocentrum_lima.AAC.1